MKITPRFTELFLKGFVVMTVFIICLFCGASCRLSHSFVPGLWLDGRDSLRLKPDGSFVYSDYRGYYQKGSEELDRTTDHRTGKWTSRANCINLTFDNGSQPGADTSISLCRRVGQLSRRQVYHTETYPSNRFRTFMKVSD